MSEKIVYPIHVTVGGKKYRLQRISNIERIRLSQEIGYVKDGKAKMDLIPLLQYCFEHVVIPDIGEKLKLEADPGESGFIDEDDLEEWQKICHRFLDREYDRLAQWRPDPAQETKLSGAGEIAPASLASGGQGTPDMDGSQRN